MLGLWWIPPCKPQTTNIDMEKPPLFGAFFSRGKHLFFPHLCGSYFRFCPIFARGKIPGEHKNHEFVRHRNEPIHEDMIKSFVEQPRMLNHILHVMA